MFYLHDYIYISINNISLINTEIKIKLNNNYILIHNNVLFIYLFIINKNCIYFI